jgi:hypothetical protein
LLFGPAAQVSRNCELDVLLGPRLPSSHG